MNLTIFNGSPRGKSSNTAILIQHFSAGLKEKGGPEPQVVYLNREKDREKHVSQFEQSSHVILAFPLYTDAMPGLVKYFIEALKPLCGKEGNPGLGFIVQSGFPEAVHSRYVEKYLEKLCRRLGCVYSGTVIKGGVEGIQVMPPWMTKKLFKNFFELGAAFAQTPQFDREIVNRMAGKERMSKAKILGFKVFSALGLADSYWNGQLKKNDAWEKRLARPFQPPK